MKTYLTPDDLAEELGLSKSTLARYRMSGDGPEYVKLGRSVMYSDQAVDEWMAEKTFSSTSQY